MILLIAGIYLMSQGFVVLGIVVSFFGLFK
jgi:hypothetical protein